MRLRRGSSEGTGKSYAIVVSRWNELVTNALVQGAHDVLSATSPARIEVLAVPGAWEIPVAVKALLESGKFDAIVALGCIIQGATPHAALLAADVSVALMRLQTETGIPVAWGVLTPDTQEQALERAGLKMGNKGREAALSAIEMANLVKGVRDGSLFEQE